MSRSGQLSEPLRSTHKKSDFSCGKEVLDSYLHEQAERDVEKKISACFVVTDKKTGRIKGYYTLSKNRISLVFVSSHVQGKSSKYRVSVSITLLGGMATDNEFQGQGVGQLMLVDALKRSREAVKTIESFAVVVDPINQDAEDFYNEYGFVKLPDSGKMFLPMPTINRLIDSLK